MDNPIRVLFLDTVMDYGGAETMTMNYYRNIDRTKVQFDFLVHREYKAEYEDEIISLGGRIFRICPPYPQNFFKYNRELKQFFTLHPEYKIIHCNMMDRGLFAYRIAKQCGVPVRICHAHTSKNELSVKNIILSFYKKLMLKYITHKFSCGIEASKYLYGENNIDDVIYMKNAVDAEKFRYNENISKEIRKEFNIENKFVIGHVGRFFPPKNHSFIIDIFAEIAKEVPDAILMLVGGGDSDNIASSKIKLKVNELGLKDKVLFTGVRSDVNRVIQAFDVFILPSLHEGFPLVLIEAQAAGLKCIVSDRVGKECNVTGQIDFLPLESGAKTWANHIINYKGISRFVDAVPKIVEHGYDIHANAKWLQEFYLNSIK